ncbi:MAG TPA: hypothetical protein VL091_00390 [Marinobacter sp.]|nr:hypothetical protein [Marinobacter sp.]
MVGKSVKRSEVRAQKIIRLVLAICASIVSFFLAWPWSRDFSYWAESHTMWMIYFAVGFVLAIYVFYVFLGNVRTLFEHDAIEREEIANLENAKRQEERS